MSAIMLLVDVFGTVSLCLYGKVGPTTAGVMRERL
jgi:hypothetical protein